MAFVEIKHKDVEGVGEVHHTALAMYAEKGWERTDTPPRLGAGEGNAALVELAPAAPAESAAKAEWVDHAVSLGADKTVAESQTKPDLIKAYGAPVAEGSN